MTQTIDVLGPVDWIVVEFPGMDFGKGRVAPILQDYVDKGLIRILDMLFLQKDETGALEFAELNEFGDSTLEQLREAETELAMVLSGAGRPGPGRDHRTRPLRRTARLGEPVGRPHGDRSA